MVLLNLLEDVMGALPDAENEADFANTRLAIQVADPEWIVYQLGVANVKSLERVVRQNTAELLSRGLV